VSSSSPDTKEHQKVLINLVRTLAFALVDQVESVEVRELEGAQTSVIELKVAKQDLGKIIGKKGRNATAIRTLLAAAATKLRKRVVLEIIE